MAKQPQYGREDQRDTIISDLQYTLTQRDEKIRVLEMNLDTAESELDRTRRTLQDKKAECNSQESKIMDLQADIGRLKLIKKSTGDGGYNATDYHSPTSSVGGGDQQEIQQMRRNLSLSRQEADRLNEDLVVMRQDLLRKDRVIEDLQRANTGVHRTHSLNQPDVHQLQLEINQLKYYNTQNSAELKRAKQDLAQYQRDNEQFQYQLRQKDNEIELLRQRLAVPSPSSSFSTSNPHYEVEQLKHSNRRLSHEMEQLQQTAAMLQNQVTCYEDDYKKEQQAKMALEDKLKKAEADVRDLQAIVDILNQDMGRRNQQGLPPPA